jgi:hypothetical protein
MKEAPLDSGLTVSEKEPDVFVLPCTTSQKRFWMLEQISPGNTALNIPIAVQLSGPLKIEVLEGALQVIMERHEILRTHFARVEGEPKQVIATQGTWKLHRIEGKDLPEEQWPDRIRQTMTEEAKRPISLETAPLLRATVLRLSMSESVLMLTAHHIISDGWSSGILVRELGLAYEALRQGTPVNLAPLKIQYADYALWQEEWLKTEDFQKQLRFWRETLAGDLPVLDFPTDFPRQSAQSTEAFLESLLLPVKLGDQLKRLGTESGVTLFMIFFSAYTVLLRRYTGQERLVIGTTAGNRVRPELEELIGLFANILILRTEVPGNMPFRELLVRQRDESFSSFAHQEAPFERVLEELKPRAGGAKVMLQTHFLFQKAFMQPATRGDLTIRPLHSLSPGSTFELTFGIVERGEGINLQMEYRTSLFRRSSIQRLLRHFQALLESIVADPETPVDQLSLFAKGEREALEAARPGERAGGAECLKVVVEELEQRLEKHWQGEMAAPFLPVEALTLGTRLVVLDQELRVLPLGIPGEVYFRAGSASSGKFLKTGFVGRNEEGGGVGVWGRAEDEVQLLGFRFNLRAVETQLRKHPDVEEAVVEQVPVSGPGRVVGYVVLRPKAEVKGDFCGGRSATLECLQSSWP